MTFRIDDGDRDKFDHSLHHYPIKKFNHSLHYERPARTPILPKDNYYTRKLKCDSIYFPGDGYVLIPDSASVSPGANASIFIGIKGQPQSTSCFFSHYDGGINKRAFIFLTSNAGACDKFKLLLSSDGSFNAGSRMFYTSSITVLDGKKHYIGFTFNTGTLKLYIDGTEDPAPIKTYDDPIATIYDTNVNVLVGARFENNAIDKFFTGSLWKPVIYGRTLSDAECVNLTQNKSISPVNIGLDQPFTTDCSGDLITKDISGNSNDGTLTNCEWNCEWIRKKHKVI